MEARAFNFFLKRANSKTAFDKLYAFYYKRIVLFLTPRFGREMARDAAQEFFIRLPKASESQDYVKNPTAWVFACAENIAKRMCQKQRRECALATLDVGSDRIEEVEKWIQRADILAALREMDDLSRKIIVYYYGYGFSQREIAEMLGVSAESVRQRHLRAKKKLRAYLTEE